MLVGDTLDSIFEARVCEAPGHVAVVCPGKQITYGELNERAQQVAENLRTMGVGSDVLVGLCLERNLEMIIGMLAILKAGGAYVPIDPTYPAKRIEFLCQDSGATVILAQTATLSCLGNCEARILCIDCDALCGPQPRSPFAHNAMASLSGSLNCSGAGLDTNCMHAAAKAPVLKDPGSNLAYVIYTSGSTGTPKGVLIEHRHVIRLFDQTEDGFDFNQDDVWAMFHSISFDFSVWEIWGALLYGATLVIVPSDVSRAPDQFHAFLLEHRVTVLNQTPSAFRQLLASDTRLVTSSKFSLRFIIFGGEVLDVKLLEPWVVRYGDQSPALINMYGITETTVHVTYKRLFKKDLSPGNGSPIGAPIPDLRVHLFDEHGESLPDGIAGEIYISGAGVARGYLNRPELSAERFVQQGGTRMYRSGDRAVRLPNGELNYLGRSDDQIKVRGFRIEPNEVESFLCGHTEVASAIVAAQDYGEGDVRLIAYIVPLREKALGGSGAENVTADLSKRAAENLPLHMRPSAYFIVPEVPLTAHGKADRTALRQWSVRQPDSHPSSPSMSSTEQVIAGIWEDILHKRNIGPQDDFFDLGGTSLALIRVFARVNDRFKLSLNAGILAEEATVSCLASRIDEQSTTEGSHGASHTPTEQVIVQIWEDILQKKNIDTSEDFFDLGGTSLALIRIFSRVNAHFNVSLNAGILAEEATVLRLASCVDAELKP